MPAAPSRKSSRLENLPPRTYSEDSGVGVALDLPPGTKLKKPVARKSRIVNAPPPPPPPPLSDEEAAKEVQMVREAYKQAFIAYRQATDGGRPDLKAMKILNEQATKMLMTIHRMHSCSHRHIQYDSSLCILPGV